MVQSNLDEVLLRHSTKGHTTVKVPKYYEAKREILTLMAGLPAGTAVPTERDLAARLGTSRTTVRQAIGELVVDGRLRRVQGSGTFVAQPKLMRVRPLMSMTQDGAASGWDPGSILLGVEQVPADAEAAQHLQVQPGSPLERVERVRTAAGERIAHEVALLPGPLPGLASWLAELGSLYRVLRECYQRPVASAEDSLETVLADPATAHLLGVDTGLPLLLSHRVAWDTDGRPLEWTVTKFRGDRFRFVARHQLETAPSASA